MNKFTKKGVIVKGFKLTNIDMKCRGFQFELGKWHTHKGKVVLCQAGFHFCKFPSGPWSWVEGSRLFEIEAEYVLLNTSSDSGAAVKFVCKKIKLVREIAIGSTNTGNTNTGSKNIGSRNTGHRNFGDRNTGDGNTGDENTGYGNLGNQNTGNKNTGNENTGYGNLGNQNTGYKNIGNGNSGYKNIGNGNSGKGNIGDENTGGGNCGNCYSGYFNIGSAPLYIFNKKVENNCIFLNMELIQNLIAMLHSDDPFDPTPYLSIPNATIKKIKLLHKAHIEARRIRERH